MKQNTVNLEDFKKWLIDEDVTFSSSTRERKRIAVMFSGIIIVSIAGRPVWQGLDPEVAVEEYNRITKRYVEEKINFTL